jgi:hypothetical protein
MLGTMTTCIASEIAARTTRNGKRKIVKAKGLPPRGGPWTDANSKTLKASYTTLAKITTSVNNTSDSMKANPRIMAS